MQVELKDLLEIRNGADYRNIDEGVVPVYGSGGQITSINKWLYDGESILLPRKGTLDNILFVYGKFWTIDTMYWSIVNRNKVVPYYLYNYLRILRFNNLHTGSTLPSMTTKAYYSIKLDLPSLDIQKKIAYILRILDSKIELNNKINAELEKIAKTLYDYWFVQFDFPDGNNRPYKSSGGAMVYNEELKREIPKGWEVRNISECCDIIDCLHNKKPRYCYESEDLYLLQLDNLTSNGSVDVSNKYYISSKDYKNWTKKIEIQENDFVCTNAGRTAAIGKIPTNVKCALGRNFTAIRPTRISSYYLRMFFNSIDMQQQVLANLDSGAFFKSFNVKSIKKIRLLIAEDQLTKTFVELIEPVINKIELNIQYNHYLIRIRDFLLPMLMNGQVKVVNN